MGWGGGGKIGRNGKIEQWKIQKEEKRKEERV